MPVQRATHLLCLIERSGLVRQARTSLRSRCSAARAAEGQQHRRMFGSKDRALESKRLPQPGRTWSSSGRPGARPAVRRRHSCGRWRPTRQTTLASWSSAMTKECRRSESSSAASLTPRFTSGSTPAASQDSPSASRPCRPASLWSMAGGSPVFPVRQNGTPEAPGNCFGNCSRTPPGDPRVRPTH